MAIAVAAAAAAPSSSPPSSSSPTSPSPASNCPSPFRSPHATASDFGFTLSSRYTANYTIQRDRRSLSCRSSCRPVTDIHAKARRKSVDKKRKPTRLFGNSWPAGGITADIQEHRKDKVSMDIISDELQGQDSINRAFASTIPEKPSSEDTHRAKYGKEATISSSKGTKVEEDRQKVTHVANSKRSVPANVRNVGLSHIMSDEPSTAISVYEDQRDMKETRLTDAKEPTSANPLTHEVVLHAGSMGDDAFLEDKKLPPLGAEQSELHLKNFLKLNSLQGHNVFSWPEAPKAGKEVEIFLNRNASTLAQQPTVKITGAYNDWRWKSFVADLKKTNLPGDWWSCKLHVPDEAYKMDFVFFDGGELYENNSNNDFSVPIMNGMQKDAFENYLIEDEMREVERVAAEKVQEEKRLAEERRMMELRAAEEADRAESRRMVNEQRERTSRVLRRAVKNVVDLWYFQPSEFQGGDTVKLFYNRVNGPLSSSRELWIHGGYNNWQEMVSIIGQMAFFSVQGGDWWTIDVEVPKHAFVLNWVLADGPPDRALVYDNNSYQDFHALVPKGVPNDLYWKDLEQQLFASLQEERHKKEEAAQKKAEYTKNLKEQLKAKTKNIFLKSQSHIFYTDPKDVQAGKPVTVFYNPSNTVLNEKPEVWLRTSFNRWMHRLGCLPPVKMLPTENPAFLKGTVTVPLDAYMMDFVFSEKGDESGCVYDNKNGLDYHVPVVGGKTKEPPMKVVHISVEMAPVAKVGGLGDVVTSLSRAIQDLGHYVEVVLPKYDCLKYDNVHDLQEIGDYFWGGSRIKIWNGTVEGLTVHFLEPDNGMFWAGCIYGRRDDGQRFGFFCHAALEYLLQTGRHPDIIHCHDWSSAPVAWLFQEHYKQSGLSNARIVFSIHNLEFGTALIGKAMAYADKATTVSETYAKEVSGNPAIAPHLYKFHGIRNGIDLDIWDPYNDQHIPVYYTSENVIEGKAAAKKELQGRLGLAQLDRPVMGIITRLTAQKGIHLIKHGIWKMLERGGQVVLLGSAPDPRIQIDFNNLANQLHNSQGDMARLCLHYDEPLSHLIYAGSDIILIPSMFEPCGLTQLIAMRYGAIPVVRRTGGLNDTVFDVDHDRDRAISQGLEPNGFSFDGSDTPGIDYALNRAISAWYDAQDWFNVLCKQVMEQDWSWSRPALDYIELYHGAKK